MRPGGTGEISTDMMQVVNYEEEFNQELAPFLAKNRIAELGFDYHVAAIMGPQSSGKSTLLNMVFGTQFRTMDGDSGRYQVTQGVWLGRDATKGIIVMDLEGTDSRERGEDAASYERKSALFALALAEVLIVNIWTQDVGRFSAANLSLLKTVMELDMQLFFGGKDGAPTEEAGKPRMHKTRLLFVLRDHVTTPFERLCDTLRIDVDNIWNSITKPDAAVGTPLTDYFDLDFYALPHKVYEAAQFKVAGAELQRRFHDNELFLPEYSRGVAADDFATYADSVWETIRVNRELDIPTQKEMLAHVRCEQIGREAMLEVDDVLSPLRAALLPDPGGAPEIASALFGTMLAVVNSAVGHYESAAERYSPAVAAMKGTDLKSKISSDCKALFDAQINLVSDIAIRDFRASVSGVSDSPKAQSMSAPWENWGEVSSAARQSALESFDKECATKALSSSDAHGHPLAFAAPSAFAARKRLLTTLDVELERATADVTAKARSHCLATFRNAFKPPFTTVLDSASDDVWERASEVASTAWEKTLLDAQSVYGVKGLGLDAGSLEVAVEDDIKPACYESAIIDVKEVVGTPTSFLMRMTKRFEDAFRFDERGVPRHFGPTEDIEALFVAAREQGEKLVDLLGEVKLSGALTQLRISARSLSPEVKDPLIFQAHNREDLREKLKRQAGAVFMEAKRAQEAAKITTKIPIWVFAMILILGWNEVLMVLRSPALLLGIIFLLPLLYFGYALDAPTMLGPAIRVTLNPLLEKARAFLDEQSGGGAQAAPVNATMGTPMSTSSADSSNLNVAHRE